MKISEIMTPDPISLDGDGTLDEALLIMDQRDVRHIPIVEEGRLIGILSDRDLLEATGWLSSRTVEERQAGAPEGAPRRVRRIMETRTVTLQPDQKVLVAAVEMYSRNIGCLPVLEGEQLRGIVSEMDLIRAFSRACRRGGIAEELDPPAESHMRMYPTYLGLDSTLADAIELSSSMGVRHLPVVNGDTLVGIVSDRDLRRAVGAGRHGELPIEEIMSRGVLTIDPDMRLSKAAQIMVDRKISALPVLDGDSLVGILTSSDILDQCLETLQEPESYAGA